MDEQYWIAIAEADWLCIRNNLAAENKPWSVIAFHAQQAAEKYLKAFLAFKGATPARIHDLEALLHEAVRFDPLLTELAEDCNDLTYHAIDARYPGVPRSLLRKYGHGSRRERRANLRGHSQQNLKSPL